jgi:hypothetical protein
MNWPRGKYNGRRIGGIDIHLRLNVLWWKWRPYLTRYPFGFHWLCVHLWVQPEYDSWRKEPPHA